MDRRSFLAGLIACPTCASLARADDGPHWTYEGAEGAGQWGKLAKTYESCSIGSEQSPIDLSGAIKASVESIKIDMKPQAYTVLNNGHTIQLNATPGNTLMLGKASFGLAQFHFHTPSEHAVNGVRTAMEVHFVHADAAGKLAVLGAFMKAGKPNAAFATIMKAAPSKEGTKPLDKPLDAKTLLPAGGSVYRYEGSLTTPPCSEIVDWTVYDKPVDVAEADIAAFKAIFPMNARPLQPLNRRFLLRS